MKHKITLIGCALCALALFPASAQDSVVSILPEKLETASGESVSPADLKGKVVALYFSAHRCAPCREFTPKLVEFHKANKDKDFEVVFLSFDNTADLKKHYIEEAGMEFLSMAGNKTQDHMAFANKYGVSAIPRLIVFGPDGKRLAEDSKDDVKSNPSGALAKWKAAAGS